MRRHGLFPALACLALLASAQAASAQPPRRDSDSNPSHVLLPEGIGDRKEAEKLLAERLRRSRDLSAVQDLLKKIGVDPKKFLGEDFLKDPKNVQKALKLAKEFGKTGINLNDKLNNKDLLKLVQEAKKQNQLSTEELEAAERLIPLMKLKDDEQPAAGGPNPEPPSGEKQKPETPAATPPGGEKPPTPPGGTGSPPPKPDGSSAPTAEQKPPTSSSPPRRAERSRLFGGWLGSLRGNSGLAGEMRNSLKGLLGPRTRLGNYTRELTSGLRSHLPGLSDLPLAKFARGFSDLVPDALKFRPREEESPSSASLPGFSSADGLGSLVLLAALLGATCLLLWALLVRFRWGGWGGKDSWRLGPWPVQPSAVRTRGDVVKAFEYLALLLLGRKASTSHHLDIAGKLGTAQVDLTGRRKNAAEELAHLYEHARYAPPEEQLSEDELETARRDLGFLAGGGGRMSTSSRRGPFAALSTGLFLLIVLAMPAPVRAQAEPQRFEFGTHALRRILHVSKFKALDNWNDLDDEPGQSLLVLLGRLRGDLHRIPGGLENFVRQGGAVLLATDQEIPADSRAGQALIRVAGTVVSGDAVSALRPTDPRISWIRATRVQAKAVYRGQPECIIVSPTEEGKSLFVGRTAGQLDEVGLATNRPSYLLNSVLPEWAHRVAEFPKGCRYDSPKGPIYLFPTDTPPAFAVRSELGNGRLLLLADHSIFINQMMLKSDNGNVDFTYNAIDWLKGDDKQRNRVLFVSDGKIETKLDIPIREEPVSLLDVQASLIHYANEQVNKIEANQPWQSANAEAVMTIRRYAWRPTLGGAGWFGFDRLLIVLGVLGALFYGLARLRRASFRLEPHVPLFAAAASRHAPSASALNQRYRHAVQEDNLGDYAHMLAQEWLGSVYRGEGPPHVIARGGWWHRRSLRNLVGRIWQLAQADVPERMSQGEFRGFLTDLERLRNALAAGDLRLE